MGSNVLYYTVCLLFRTGGYLFYRLQHYLKDLPAEKYLMVAAHRHLYIFRTFQKAPLCRPDMVVVLGDDRNYLCVRRAMPLKVMNNFAVGVQLAERIVRN